MKTRLISSIVIILVLFCSGTFTQLLASAEYAEHEPAGIEQAEHAHDFSLWKLVKPFGLATLSLLLLTAILGILMWFKPGLRGKVIKIHRLLGILAAAGGLAHALIIFLID